jgi:hypothetical protein
LIVIKNAKVSFYGGRTLNNGYEGKVLLNDEVKTPKSKEI